MESSNTDLGKESIGKLIFKLSTPAIIAQLVNVLYNIVDRIFIGRMPNGNIAMAGVGVAFPIILIVSAFSALVGMGGAPLASIKMGQKDNEGAEKILCNSFILLIILSIILTSIFSIFKEPILWMFGASDASIEYALSYISIYLIGTIFVQISLGMNPYINTQGFANIGMITVVIGAVINVILDPILIFGFNLGVKGAALATIIAQGVSALWVLKFLLGKKTILKIRKKYLKIDRKIIFRILSLGISPFIMQSTESIVLISLNSQLAKYGGDLAIGAMTIMSSIMQIVLQPIVGLTQGTQPIVSYNYGAKNLDRVKKAFKICSIICFSYTTIMWAALMIMPQTFVSIFNNDSALMEIAKWSIRIYFAGIFIFGIQIACQQTFLSLGQAKMSLILALLRKVLLLIPLIFILPLVIKNQLFAVFLAEPVADIIAALTTMTCFMMFYKKNLLSMDSLKDNE